MVNPQQYPTRREALRRAAGGLGSIALSVMLSEMSEAGTRSSAGPADPLAPRPGHFAPKARRVIFLYMTGGVSHVDSFDPKPKLFASANKTVRVNNFQGRPGDFTLYLKSPQFAFRPGGSCGTEVSDLFPHMRSVRGRPLRDPVDVVGPHQPLRRDARHAHRVVHLRSAEHRRLGELRPGYREPEPALVRGGRPSAPLCGPPDLGVGFLARLPPGHPHRARRDADRQREAPGRSDALQRLELEMVADANRRDLERREADAVVEARIRSFETAYGMQLEAPEVFDLSGETTRH